MSLNFTAPETNPRLGSSFAIFASFYVCLAILLVIAEQLGVTPLQIDETILLAPLLIYVAVGIAMRSGVEEDFFVSGQRVPPLFAAMSMCAAAFGGSVVLGSIGVLFFLGIDGLAIPIGLFFGFILMGLLFVPFLRKAGAHTLAGFFYLRFGRAYLRAFAAVLVLVPCFLLLTAEVSVGQRILEIFFLNGQASAMQALGPFGMKAALLAAISLSVIFGGMRSAGWTSSAQIIVFLCLIAPLAIVSVARTNLPLPQLTYGAELEQIKALEAARNYVTVTEPQTVDAAIPTLKPAAVTRPAERAFSAFSATGFLLLIFSLATGVAANPALLPKLSTTQTIQVTRRAMGWTAAIAGAVVLTIPAYAVFVKAMAVEGLVGIPASDVPGWAAILKQSAIVTLSQNQFDQLGANVSVLFRRDTVAFILPIAGNMPRVLMGVVGAAMLAAVCACAGAQILAMGNTLSDDIVYGRNAALASPRQRVFAARVAMAACAIAAAIAGQDETADSLRLALFAFALSGGAFFPVLVLSVWWRRLTALGVFAGLGSGFAATGLVILSDSHMFGIDSLTAGAIGVPAGFLAAVAVSTLSGPPDDKALEATDDLRIPAGETLQSRMIRLSTRTKPKTT